MYVIVDMHEKEDKDEENSYAACHARRSSLLSGEYGLSGSESGGIQEADKRRKIRLQEMRAERKRQGKSLPPHQDIIKVFLLLHALEASSARIPGIPVEL
jgi:hypothetical protein